MWKITLFEYITIITICCLGKYWIPEGYSVPEYMSFYILMLLVKISNNQHQKK